MRVFYFDDVLPDARAVRLGAAIVWRPAPDGARRGARLWGRWPVGWLRRLRHRLWLRLGPLGIDLHVQWPGRPRGRGGGGFTSVPLLDDGEPTAHYGRGELRVLGRVYKLPPEGRSLVLLVDEGGRAAPRIRARTVPAPTAPMPEPPAWALEAPLPGLVEGVDYVRYRAAGGEWPGWADALRADPDVRAFMEAEA